MATPRNTTKKNIEKAPSRKVVSARGEIVDFDLLKIKAQINESSPKSIEVVARERFIDKRRRRTSRKIDEMLQQQADSTRYAEEAIKFQHEQKAASVGEDVEEVGVDVVAQANPFDVEQEINAALTAEIPLPEEKTQKSKFNRRLNK